MSGMQPGFDPDSTGPLLAGREKNIWEMGGGRGKYLN